MSGRLRSARLQQLCLLLWCVGVTPFQIRPFHEGLSSAIGAQCVRPWSIYSEPLTTRRISEADIDVGRGVASGEEGARKGRLGFMWRKGAATQKRATGPSTPASNVQGRIQEDATLLIKLSEYSRGGMTAPNMVTLLNKRAEMYKAPGSSRGADPAEVLRAASLYVRDEKRRALLLDTFSSQSRSQQAASVVRFGAAAGEGEAIGGLYIVAGGSGGGARVSSGKSGVVDGIRLSDQMGVKIKLSKNLASIGREADNLRTLRTRGGKAAAQGVISMLDFFENYDGRGSHALVMEAGQEDVANAIKRSGPFKPRVLKKASRRVLQVLNAMASLDLVWTDLTPANLVLVNQDVKAIDLESAVSIGSKPVDCSPESTPPEVARLYCQGKLTQAAVSPSYDVWSLGTLLFFMATGKLFVDAPSSARVMQQAATLTQADVDLRISSSIRDGALAKLLTRALQVDPSRRASASELLGSWYFKRPW